MLIHDLAVAQDQPDRSSDLTGIDVLLYESVNTREPIGCKPSGRSCSRGLLCSKHRRTDGQQCER
jgi:hypothetical protein